MQCGLVAEWAVPCAPAPTPATSLPGRSLFGGGVQKWTLAFGGLPHPTSISTALWEQRSGVTHLQARGEPCIPRRCPRQGGVGPCHGVALIGAQRLSPRNLPVAADHFRCQTGFVSLGGAPPSLLDWTGAKSGFKKTSLAVGGGRSHPPKPRGHARFALRLPWGLLLEHPWSEARLTPWHRAEHPPPRG